MTARRTFLSLALLVAMVAAMPGAAHAARRGPPQGRTALPLEEPPVRTLNRNGLNRRRAKVFVQSFEVATCARSTGCCACRSENFFLPLELRFSADPAAYGDFAAEVRQFFALGVDGLFTDNPDKAVAARG